MRSDDWTHSKNDDEAPRLVTVIGAGFSGLAAAYYLQRAGYRVEVIEERERPGGLISTLAEPFGRVETAANGLLNSVYVEELFSELGLEIAPTLASAKKRYIFRAGGAKRWPLGLSGTLRLLLFSLRYFFSRSKVSPRAEESVRAWADRVFGSEVRNYLIEAFLQGVYAGDPGRMSASIIFGRFFSKSSDKKTSQQKPRIRGTVSAPEGMGQLIEVWRTYLEKRGVAFRFGAKAPSLDTAPDAPVVIATAAPAAADLLEKLDPLRAEKLRKIEILPLVTATVAFSQPTPVRGFGCLFPPIENRRALGVLMNESIFAHRVQSGYSETWILGGAHKESERILSMSDGEILRLIQEERVIALKASPDEEPKGVRMTRWPRALPHYTVEVEALLPHLSGLRENVVLIGNYLGQIGLAKILESALHLPHEIRMRGIWKGEQ